MNLFQRFFGNKVSIEEPSIGPSNKQHQSFSTPFLKIGAGNLGSPYINPYYTVSGIVQFGQDNLYPQILDQMYFTSSIHGACINFLTNSTIGGGYTYSDEAVTGKEKVDQIVFEKGNKISKLLREITEDFIVHRRVTILVIRDINGKFKKIKRLNPATIRNNKDCTKFVWCLDWSRRTGLVEYNRYEPLSKDKESLFVYQAESRGQDIYPLPTYISALNDCYLDGEIAYLQKSNIQNSIWPSLVVKVPHLFESADEVEQFKEGIKSKSGAKGAGNIMVLTGNGKDDVPEVDTVTTNSNDKLFDTTLDSIQNKICLSHGINPSIMGIKVSGSLGNAQELQMSYGIYEKNIVMPLRSEIEEIINDIIQITGYKNSIILNNYQIIDNTIAEVQSVDQQIGFKIATEINKNKQN